VALDTMAAPAVVLDLDGEVLLANVGAEAELGPAPRAAARLLARGSTAPEPGRSWRLTPLGRASEAIGFLAIGRTPPTEQALRAAVYAAGER